MTPPRAPITTLLVIVALFAACNGAGSDGQNMSHSATGAATRDGGRLVIGVQHEPEMLSDILQSTAVNNLVASLIFSKFVKYDDQLKLIPDVIQEIPTRDNGGISADHRRYTYHLRAGVKWHDGVALTSRDVRFTYNVIMNPKVNVESREGWDVIERVDTPDDTTVVFHLKRTYPDFVAETFYEESILPEHILREYVGEGFHSAPFHHRPVGSGPFRFREWVSGSHLIVDANPDYYGNGPHLDHIILKFIPNENTLLVQLKTGEIDLFDNANITFVDQLMALPGIRVHRTQMLMYEHLDLNMANPLLADVRVRQAIAHAVNKVEIAERVYNGMVAVAHLDDYEKSPYYSPAAASVLGYDPMRARILLKQAGWEDSNGDGILDRDGKPLALEIVATAGQPNRERAELVLRDQLRKVGIDLSIRNYNPTVLYGTYDDGGILKRGRFDLAMYAWLVSPEPAMKQALYSGNSIPPRGQNHPRIDHPELTRLLEAGAAELDAEKRQSIYYRVHEVLVEQVPVVPLFWYTSVDPCTVRLQNYRPNPTQSADTWNASEWYLGSPPGVARR